MLSGNLCSLVVTITASLHLYPTFSVRQCWTDFMRLRPVWYRFVYRSSRFVRLFCFCLANGRLSGAVYTIRDPHRFVATVFPLRASTIAIHTKIRLGLMDMHIERVGRTCCFSNLFVIRAPESSLRADRRLTSGVFADDPCGGGMHCRRSVWISSLLRALIFFDL